MQISHKKGRLGPGQVPHEKTNVVVAHKIQRVLVPDSNEDRRAQLYEADEETAWFGEGLGQRLHSHYTNYNQASSDQMVALQYSRTMVDMRIYSLPPKTTSASLLEPK